MSGSNGMTAPAGIGQRGITLPRVGKQAPDFDAEAYVPGDPEPRRVRLADHTGSWVVLFFYPRDFTFVCPTEIQAFARLHHAFAEENAVVIAASTDSWHSHNAWFRSDERLSDVRYPVVADASHELAASYGVLLEDGSSQRGTFIIDPEGTLRHLAVNDDDVGRNVDETLRTLRATRTGELCPAGWQPGEATLTGAAV